MNNQDTAPELSKKALIIIAAVFVAIVGIFIAFNLSASSSDGENYALDVSSGEVVAMTGVRSALADSALDGSGSIDEQTCETLGSIAKKFDSKASWFASCSFDLLGSTPDTSTNQVTKLSDEDYCATFTLDSKGETVTAYSFTEGECGNSRISIK